MVQAARMLADRGCANRSAWVSGSSGASGVYCAATGARERLFYGSGVIRNMGGRHKGKGDWRQQLDTAVTACIPCPRS
jgi:hypothetical protein